MKKKEYTPALGFDWLSGWYDLTIKLTMPERKFRHRLMDLLNPGDGEDILEFGFGSGANLLIAAARFPGSHFVGLDIDPKIREVAERRLSRSQLDIRLELYDGYTFPFSANSFDKVYSCLVFHHLDRQTKIDCLKEIHRVMRPGGKLLIGDWGKAKSRTMRIAFYIVQLLDGFKTTNDNVNGLLPNYLEKAGFTYAGETGFINTKIGSFCYYEGSKP
ncbi:MAG: class I SAM-dependent methyltransferase [Cyclobacteriaceae bacterium]